MSKLRAAAIVLTAGLAGLAAHGQTGPGGRAGAESSYRTSDGQVRAAKMLGATVYNEDNQTLGTVDDILLAGGTGVTLKLTAIISVMEYPSLGAKLVAVPFAMLHIQGDKLVMPGESRAALSKMPAYKYKPESRWLRSPQPAPALARGAVD